MFTRNVYFQYSHRAVSVITAFTLVFSSFVFALPQIASAVAVPMCNGQAATIYVEGGFIVSDIPADNGDPYTGTLNGDSSNDVIVGTSGNDIINAGSGNNTICSLDGNDTVDATGGNDWISVAEGNNVVDAGSGNNTITSGDGNNTIDSEGGNDSITTGSGNDEIDAGSGNNTINAGDGNNTIDSEGGNDSITTGSGNDEIDAGSGNNTINAGDGNNEISTAGGSDIVTTGTGNDIIKAGSGANTVNSGGGHDSIDGDGGTDIFDAGAGYDFCDAGSGSNTLTNCEVTGGTEGIIIAKEASPESSQSFSFTGGLGSFSLVDNGVTSNYSFFNPSNTTYTVEETVPSGWDLTSISCWDPSGGTTTDLGDGEAVIDFDNNEAIVCTFTNTQNPPTLIVNKVIVNDEGGTVTDEEDFSFTINDGDAIAFEADGSNEVTVEAGSYEVVEEAATGYTAGYSADCTGTIAAGETKTCTITNNDIFVPAGDMTAPDMPVHLWPEDGAIMPSPFLTKLDWTDVTDESEPVAYYYESAFSSATSTGTYGDDFTSPVYQSGALAASEIPALGTSEGTYFWHVRAVDDEGNSTPWTAPWSVTVDNTPPDVTVTIVKYIDDEHATAENTGSASFPMYAIYPGGEGNYSLTTTGFNNPNPYEATTSNMPWGSDYSTYEITSAEGPVYPVGADCSLGSYRLVGYKTGNTLEQAEADDISTDVPVFDGLMTSKYVIVVNEACTLGTSQIIQPTESEETSGTTELEAYYADENGDGNDGVQWAVRAGTCAANTGTVFGNVDGKNTPFTWDGTNFNATIDTTQVANGPYCFVFNPTEDGGNTNQRLTRTFSINNPLPDVKVHMYKYLQSDETTEQVPDDYEPATVFPMKSSWNDPEGIGSGADASYVLGNNHGGAALKYAADTSAMTSGADYSTYEDTYPGNSSSNVLAPTESCQVGYYKLVGYKSSTTSLEDAEEASLTTTAPSFTGLENDAYVIVVNKYCGEEPEVTYADEVTMCKVDQSGNERPGWTLYLKGDTVQTLNVNSNSSLGADSSVLDDYTSYLAFVSGTWSNQNGANLVDAEYSTTDSWTSYMDGYTGYGNDILDLQFNEGFINWGSYDSDHSYVYGFTPVVDGSVNFRVFDGTDGVQNEGWFNDNSGSLSVAIAKGFIGETDETGCVTFENVPYGSYTVGEIQQDGWTNVPEEEGTVAVGDTVVVEGSEQVFTLMNDSGEEEPVYGSITIVKEIQGGEDATFTFDSETLGEGGFDVTTVEGTGDETFSSLLAGTYDVTEVVPEGWEQVSAVCSDESPVGAIGLAAGENVTCTFTNQLIEDEGDGGGPVETFSFGGGGNGPVVGAFGAVLGASTGQVLGASTGGLPELPNGCSALVSSYMRRGMNNDPEQVKLLQSFLNSEMGLSMPVTGFFGILTENAVKAFQLKYAEQILAPWGITQPTGYVYKTTQRWVNLSHCSSLSIPMPDLSN